MVFKFIEQYIVRDITNTRSTSNVLSVRKWEMRHYMMINKNINVRLEWEDTSVDPHG